MRQLPEIWRNRELHAQTHPGHRILIRHRPRHRAASAAAGQHVYAGIRSPADGDQLARSASGWRGHPAYPRRHRPRAPRATATTAARHHSADNWQGRSAWPAPELVQLEAFRRQLEVNVTGQLAVAQAMLPSLRRARGRIVMVSAIGPLHRAVRRPLDAAKAALAALGTRCARNWSHEGAGGARRAGQHQQRCRRKVYLDAVAAMEARGRMVARCMRKPLRRCLKSCSGERRTADRRRRGCHHR